MPVDGSLLNAPSGEELARHRLSLYRSALALAARIADVSYTSRILEAQLEDAVRFLVSDECPTAKKLNEKLSQIEILVTTTSRKNPRPGGHRSGIGEGAKPRQGGGGADGVQEAVERRQRWTGRAVPRRRASSFWRIFWSLDINADHKV